MKIFSLPKIATQSPCGGFFRALMSRADVEFVSRDRCVNCENTCSTVVSCGVDNRKRNVFAGNLHRCVDALSCCRLARVARSAIAASTLP
jgi:hypothetical protein